MNTLRSFAAGAPSKLILLGEHAVVHGSPALAVPLEEPSSRASARLTRPGDPLAVELPDFKLAWTAGAEPAAEEARPFPALLRRAVSTGLAPDNGWSVSVAAEVPIGCGLGSGASIAASAFRAVYGLFGAARSDRDLSDDVFEVEKVLHGTPSGVDNTVVAHGRPVLFLKGASPAFLAGPGAPLFLAVADTGIRHRTSEVVAEVASRREASRERFDILFSRIGELALSGAGAFERGDAAGLGALMDQNHELLTMLGVSCPELDRLVRAARSSGALGAKLCGAGRGGCMAALAPDRDASLRLAAALREAGAKRVFTARIGAPSGKGERPPFGGLAFGQAFGQASHGQGDRT
ncbi:MAG: mevalonate kinase [Elusimicrobiota bacterium]